MFDRRFAPLFAIASLLTLGIIVFGTPSMFRYVFTPVISINAAAERSDTIPDSAKLVSEPSLIVPINDDLLADATAILFSTGNAWLTPGNWTGGAVPTGTQVAQFAAIPASSAGINFNSTTNAGTQTNGLRVEEVGAIEVTSSRAANLIIGNSSSTAGAAGTLRPLGVTVNGQSNVIIRNSAPANLIIQNTQGTGNQTMSLELVNQENVINLDGNGGVTINSIITGSGKNLTLAGTGFNGSNMAMLNLGGVNTYSGNTTIKPNGFLVLIGNGSIASSPVIDINGGGGFDVSSRFTPLTLSSGQSIKASGTTSTGTIYMSSTNGLTTAADTSLIFSAFNGTTPPLTVSNGGVLSLQSSNPVTVTIANSGTPLGIGDYKLIAKIAPASVGVNTPTSLTVNGDGIAAGTGASLINISGELYLHVTAVAANLPPTLTPGTYAFTTIGEDAGANTGQLISAFIASTPPGTFGDGNGAGQPQGLAVTAVDNTNGTWQFSTNNGSSWTSFGTPSASAARLLASDASATRIRFVPNSNFNGTTSITFLAWDQSTGTNGGTANTAGNGTGTSAFSSSSATGQITVTAVNDAPVNTVPGPQTVNGQTPLVFSVANGNRISIGDADDSDNAVVGDELMQVTLAATNGTTTLSTTSGLTFAFSDANGTGTGDGTADATMTFRGAVANINNALNSMSFTANAGFAGGATLAITTNDLGNFGAGGTLADTDAVGITVTATNDPPVNTVPGPQSVQEDTALVFSVANGNRISMGDPDDADNGIVGDEILQVTLTATNGTTTLGSIAGLNFIFSDANGTGTGDGNADPMMTFRGTLASINNALNGMSFTGNINFAGAGTLVITTNDLGNFGTGGPLADTDTVGMTVTAVNDAPVNTVPGPQAVQEETALVLSLANGNRISVGDVDDADNGIAGDELLQATLTASGGTMSLNGTTGLSFVFSDANGSGTGDGTADATMTFRGTLTNINNALNGMSFTGNTNMTGGATLQITTNDLGNFGTGTPLADTDAVGITITAVNDAPANTVPGPQSVQEDTALVLSLANGNRISVNDPDDSDNGILGDELLQVTLTASGGTMSLNGTTGLSFAFSDANGTGSGDGTADATMTFRGTLTNINNALNGMSFTGNTNFAGAATLQITTNDLGNFGTGTPLVDTDTVGVTVSAANDVPSATVPPAQNAAVNTTVVFSSGNSNQISISDVDDADNGVINDEVLQVAMTAANGTITLNGTTGLSFSFSDANGDGFGDGTADSFMRFRGTLGNINAALNGLSFIPTSGFHGTATLAMTTNDLGNFGSGGPQSSTAGVNINFAAPGSLQFTSATYSSTEQTLQASVTVSRTGVTDGAVSTPLTFTNGTATGGSSCSAGVDFINSSQTLSFADGESGSKTFNITLCNDGVYEANETFTATLGPSTTGGATVGGQSSATVTITDTIPTTLVVNSIADTNDGFCTPDPGGCTLREAIIAANTNSDLSEIFFNIPGGGVHTIVPLSQLPQLTQGVVIDGYSQPGSQANSLPVGDNSIHLIEISGENFPVSNLAIGLDIAGSSGSVRGLVINRFGLTNIRLTGSGNTLEGSFIGTDPTGTLRRFNSASGVEVVGVGNTVGGGSPGMRNVISGNNGFQLRFFAAGTAINNYIGTNASGTGRLDSSGGNGISSSSSFTNIINNVISGNGGSGVMFFGTFSTPNTNNMILGNYIGVDAAGTTRLANDGQGIQFQGRVINSSIGDGTAAGRNIISGNGLDFGGGPFGGVVFQNETDNSAPNGVIIRGNFIGTDVTGTAAIPNRDSGIILTNASSNTIGGSAADQGNVISGNFRRGIFIQGSTATNNIVRGNLVGTQADGISPLGNGDLGGVFISSTAAHNVIGGLNAGEGNVIANNAGAGIRVDEFGGGNIFRGNSIYNNGGLGIDLDVSGVNINDLLDPDQNGGGDPIQNYPLLLVNTGSLVTGTLNSTPNTNFDIDFYRVDTPDASGFGEGKTYIGTQNVTTDMNGDAAISFSGGTSGAITSTATSTNAATLSTSEFSNVVLSPTAAPVSISGHVLTADGQGIGRAKVIVTGGNLTVPVYGSTSATGAYTVSGLTAGQTYIVTVGVKRMRFPEPQRVVNLLDDLTGFDFVANPQ